MSDEEPPSKVLKQDDLTRKDRIRQFHQDVLNNYGISELFEPTCRVDQVPNEIIVALLYFQKKMPDILQITKKMLGVKESGYDRNAFHRFKRHVQKIESDAKKQQRRSGEDKCFNFSKIVAFDKSFFASQHTEKDNCETFGSKTQDFGEMCSKNSAGTSDVAHQHQQCQTEMCCYIDLQNPEKYPISIKNLHCSCVSQYGELRKKNFKEVNKLRHWKKYHQNLILKSQNARSLLKKANIVNQKILKSFENKTKKLAEVEAQLKEKGKELFDVLTRLDNTSGIVDLKEGKSYSNKTVEAVISLKTIGVADEKVGEVMQIVGKLVGISFKSTPSASCCRNFALASLYLGQSHIKIRLSELVANGESLCLASDETVKGTAKLQAFGVHSSGGTFTCLGIEQVAEKSAQTALNALETIVSQLPDAPTDFFKKFVVSVTSTMSDSARTELKFNDLVDNFRSKAIPEVVENYDKLSDTEKAKISQFSSFFCQLHILANYTKIVLKSILEHELTLSKVQKLDEPSVFTLIKLVSQLFGQRGSGMHGILQMWVPWCKKFQVNRFTFPSFIGNRFNIVFVLASRIFFHRHHLKEFAAECESLKPDLKKVKEMLENEMITEHLQVLGLCDQLVTGPLWRLAEGCEHILDTCRYALQLEVWLEECSAYPVSFFDGTSPTPNLQLDCPTNSILLHQALVNRDPTEMGAQVASLVCTASGEYFSRAFVDFLPGGKHCNDADEIRKSTESAPSTNRNIESVFGVISHFFDTKPNMRLDVRVALTLFKKNHTLSWFQSLPEQDQDKILTESRAALDNLRNASNSRQVTIENLILQQMKEKNQAAAKKQAKKLNDRRTLTKEILTLGFWQNSDDIKNGLTKLSTEKNKRDAVLSQLRFRQKVIEQPAPSPKFFNASVNQKPIPINELIEKLKLLFEKDQGDDQLLLSDHEYVGKKFIETSPSNRRSKPPPKAGFVQDLRINGIQKTVTVVYENDDDSHKIDFAKFQKAVSDGFIIFHN